jgi:hypothetical protein
VLNSLWLLPTFIEAAAKVDAVGVDPDAFDEFKGSETVDPPAWPNEPLRGKVLGVLLLLLLLLLPSIFINGNLKALGCGPSLFSKRRRNERGAFIDSVALFCEDFVWYVEGVSADIDSAIQCEYDQPTAGGIASYRLLSPPSDRLIGPFPLPISTSKREVTVYETEYNTSQQRSEMTWTFFFLSEYLH